MSAEPLLVGVISDTHGRLDNRVLELFADVSHIIHAGDIGDEELLWKLEDVAPVIAVRGNNDPDTMAVPKEMKSAVSSQVRKGANERSECAPASLV